MTDRGRKETKYFPRQMPTAFDKNLIAWLKHELYRISSFSLDPTTVVKVGDELTKLSAGSAEVDFVAASDGAGHIVWKAGGGGGAAVWGGITGDISDQTDLTPAAIGAATAAQGALADSALQPGDSVLLLSSGVSAQAEQILKADGSGNVFWETAETIVHAVPFFLTDGTSDQIVITAVSGFYYLPFFLTNGTQDNIALV